MTWKMKTQIITKLTSINIQSKQQTTIPKIGENEIPFELVDASLEYIQSLNVVELSCSPYLTDPRYLLC